MADPAPSPAWPACLSGQTRAVRIHAVAAAEHFVPKARFPDRNAELQAYLVRLWGGPGVEVRECAACGMGFVWPWVAGDARFCKLVRQGKPWYPSNRWEFDEAINELQGSPSTGTLSILELGGGKGAFITRLLAAADRPVEAVALDCDAGAVATMRAQGIEAHRGSLEDLPAHGSASAGFGAVVSFQTIEYIAVTDCFFEGIRNALESGGSFILSVPNAPGTAVQEELTGFWDMPPNHVGRWTEGAVRSVADRNGFEVAAIRTDDVSPVATAWMLAEYRARARAYVIGTLAQRAHAIRSRAVRGALLELRAATHLPGLLAKRSRFLPAVLFAHLRRTG